MNSQSDYPEYLDSYESLSQHFRAQLEGLSTTEKGKRFAHLAQKLVPQTDTGNNFDLPTLSDKISGDGGVDLVADSKTGNDILYIQSKLWVDRAEAIDNVMSKFQAYTSPEKPIQPSFFELSEEQGKTHFLLVTLSKLGGIIKQYEKTAFASKAFYNTCKEEARIHFIDGHDIYQALRTIYSKLHHIPMNLTLTFATDYVQLGNVYIGVLSSDEIKSLHRAFGDALFFENVRDFLGVQSGGRTTPNDEIIKTLANDPEKLLSRNNGIVFGAARVEPGSNPRELALSNGSVVNGCQTTMCIVEYSQAPCFVLTKVVQTDNAWDITKSANYQTSVADIDLELARYIRPQLVRRAAANIGVQLDDMQRSAFQVIDELYERRVAYSETRLLYVGLFSRNPNNVLTSNYAELMQDLIKRIYQEPSYEEDVFETLFLLQGNSRVGLDESKKVFVNPSYTGMFDRLFKDESLSYRCFLSVLALCGAVKMNVAEHLPDNAKEFDRMKEFLRNARETLKNHPDLFLKYYKLAVKLWMQEMMTYEEEALVRRDMAIRTKRLNFNTMYRKLCMDADLEMSSSPEITSQ